MQTVATFGLNWEQLKYDGFELHYKNDFKVCALKDKQKNAYAYPASPSYSGHTLRA